MNSNRFSAALSVSALVLQPLAAMAQAAAPQTAPAEIPTFGVGTAAVTLDVVVRDKKGRVVPDLKASDFEIYEDGVRQQVESFQVFGRPPEETAERAAEPTRAAPATPTPTAAPVPTSSDTETRPQVIAFIFDRLSPDARNIAHKAAMAYVERGYVEGDLVAVFAIDLALRTIQPFTRDTSLIRAGLQQAATQANTAYGVNRGQTRDIIDVMTAGQQTSAAATGANPGQGASSGSIGSAAAAGAFNQAVAQVQSGMLRQFEALERDQQGYASTNGLLSVVSGLKSLPGRKTVVFFSEGLAIPPNVQAQFRSVIATANRANVSVYAMDAAGLRAESMDAETRKEMLQAAERRVRQLGTGRDDASDGIMSRQLERNEDLLRLNPGSGLGQLANETGGFLIRDTNDAASAFRRIEEDMRFHYLLAYSPSNENYDGRFRTISVKVSRPGLQLQTRQGYYAVRAVDSVPLRSFEAPALVRLDRRPTPRDFPVEAVALSFPTPARPGLAPLLVRVPGQTIAYALDKQDKSPDKIHRAELTVVARLKDEAGREVDRLSQRYEFSTSAANLEAARRGDILFYREADLPPGRYTLEAVAYDAVADKASVSTAALEVPATAAGGPRLSSIVLVGRVDKASPGEQSQNPLFYGDTIIYPNMGEPFRKATSTALGFFFTLYGAKEASKATLEVYKAGQKTGQVSADLPAPDVTGRVQYAGALPLQGFAPGSYTLKVTATTASGTDSRQVSFAVTE